MPAGPASRSLMKARTLRFRSAGVAPGATTSETIRASICVVRVLYSKRVPGGTSTGSATAALTISAEVSANSARLVSARSGSGPASICFTPDAMCNNWRSVIFARASFRHSGTGAGVSSSSLPSATRKPINVDVMDFAIDQLINRVPGP